MKGPVEHAIAGEDGPPRIDSDQVARPERQHHGEQQEGADARAGDPGRVIGDWNRQDDVGHGDRQRDADRPDGDRAVDVDLNKKLVVGKTPVLNYCPRDRVLPPKGRDQKKAKRTQEDD